MSAVCLRDDASACSRKSRLTRGIDARLRHPAALLITHGDDVVRADAHAVRIAKAGGVHVQFCTVGRDAQDRAAVRVALGALGEKEVPFESVSRLVLNEGPPPVANTSLLKFS